MKVGFVVAANRPTREVINLVTEGSCPIFTSGVWHGRTSNFKTCICATKGDSDGRRDYRKVETTLNVFPLIAAENDTIDQSF